MKTASKKNLTLLVLFLSFPALSRAELLIRAPDVPAAVYQGILDSDPDRISPIEYFERQSPSEAEKARFLRLFEKAQRTFLNADEEGAVLAFGEVVSMAPTADWNSLERQAFVYSFMRLAQIVDSPQEQETFIHKAVAFDPDLAPDTKLFPPPLIEAWRVARDKLEKASVVIDCETKFPGYDRVKVNGRSYEIHESPRIRLPPGEHRISLLSNSHPYFSQVLNGSQLQVLKVEAQSLAAGTCKNPQLGSLSSLPAASHAVLYSGPCIRVRTASGWLPLDGTGETAPLASPLKSPPESVDLWNQNSVPSPEPSNRKAWIWIGLSVVAATSAWLIYRDQTRERSRSQEPQVQPVVREGF